MKKYLIISVFVLIGILIIISLVKKNKEENEPPINTNELVLKYSKDPSKNIPHTPLKIIHDKKFGHIRMFCCIISDTNWVLIKNECNELLKSDEIGFVFCYDDITKVKDITKFTDPLVAAPDDGKDYIFEYNKTPSGKGYSDVLFYKYVNNLKK
ncbi:MAG: hypothetical protein NTW16_00230 [Bacteroidetes bacterium]|nr:hypothetical protein [Bacteroidota bacterium]